MAELLFIFFAKVIEVTLTTLRMLFVNRGAKGYASTIGFVEILVWVTVASFVLDGIHENPARMIVYALGFSVGSFIGIKIEERIGLGYSKLEIITNQEDGEALAEEIRKFGKAVTITQGEGRDGDRIILTTFLRRKNKEIVINKAKEMDAKGVITVSEIQKAYGGFGLK